MLFYQTLPSTIHGKILKNSYKNNKFKIFAATRNERFQLTDGSYYVLDIQDYFKDIIKNHEEVAYNPPIRKYVNKTGDRITFRMKTGYYIKLLMPKTMKLLGSTKSKINKDENGENVLI